LVNKMGLGEQKIITGVAEWSSPTRYSESISDQRQALKGVLSSQWSRPAMCLGLCLGVELLNPRIELYVQFV